MPLNISGTLSALTALFNPRLFLPSITVPDIRYLNWKALRDGGFRGVVFDRDNCITRPHEDRLIPELQDSWEECLSTFSPSNVLIVSNSAGTLHDPGYLAAESLTANLKVPVLQHASPKPSQSCRKDIASFFMSSNAEHIPTSKLIIVGDRLLTDVLMANQKDMQSLSVLTTRIWASEGWGMRILRKGEEVLENWARRRLEREGGVQWESWQEQRRNFVRRELLLADEMQEKKLLETRNPPSAAWEGRKPS